MDLITLTIDDTKLQARQGATVLEAAQAGDIYIPRLCAHPDLPPPPETKAADLVYRSNQLIKGTDPDRRFEGCGLCAVEIEGMNGFPLACATPAAAGMVVHTNRLSVQELRQSHLSRILAKHPHACLTCAQREGCSREPCSLKVAVVDRCCPQLGRCELQRVAEYIGIRQDTPRYIFRDLPIKKDEPLFDRNYNLCIGCGRCVRVCHDVRGVGALGFVWQDGEVVVGTTGPSLKESGCKFCGACVEVCPTGASTDRDIKRALLKEAVVPCVQACPAGVDIPRYIRLIAEGKPAQAMAVIREKVPLPSILGHVCSHPCEAECRRGQLNEPISICALKRFASEHDTGLWRAQSQVAPASGKQVAIVGAGPAGLTAAYYLAKLGHRVTVFDSLPELGGMMGVGIPGYRLPKEIRQRDIDEILKLGVEVKVNTPIGSLADLKQQGYDAIFIATGAHQGRPLGMEGVDLDGVFQGVYLLRDRALGKLAPDFLKEQRVIVIGGGNVAIDAARTSLRLGATEVQLVCLESRQEMPAHEWETLDAVAEGVVLRCSWGPKRILGHDNKVAGIESVRCTSVFDAEGRFNPSFDETTQTSFKADKVIIAIGQASDLSFLGPESGIQPTRQGTIKVADTLETGVPGIFAGGEVVSGPASVIKAVAAGRQAAMSIDKLLGGQGVIDEMLAETEKPDPWLGRDDGFADRCRVPMPCQPVGQRLKDFAEVELGFDEAMAVEEARRCLRCELRLHISPVRLPPDKWLDFTSPQVGSVPEIEGVYQLLDEQKTIIYIAGTMNLRHDLEGHLSASQPPLSKARYFGYEENPMFTARESELIQQFLQEHGSLPEGNEDLY